MRHKSRQNFSSYVPEFFPLFPLQIDMRLNVSSQNNLGWEVKLQANCDPVHKSYSVI
jgi:hypothetical protein